MFRFSLAMLIVVVSFRLSEQLSLGNRCPNGWQYFDGSCYVFMESKQTWSSARAICESHGAKLAEIDNKRENIFLKDIARSESAEKTWLGGTDKFSEGYWTWASDSRSIYSFTDWGPGQPDDNGRNQDCMTFLKRDGYFWDDDNCSELANFICEEGSKHDCCH